MTVRRISFYAICLLLGALAAVLSSWVCVWVAVWPAGGATPKRMEPAPRFSGQWPRAVPSHWPRPRDQFQDGQSGFQLLRTVGRTGDLEQGVFEKSEHYLIDIYNAGWPVRALQWEVWNEFEINRGSGSTKRFDGHPENTLWLVGLDPPAALARRAPWKRLPIRPTSATAFLTATLFFGAIIIVIGKIPSFLRRAVRRRRGRCPNCGYPSGSAPLCTECGQALSIGLKR